MLQQPPLNPKPRDIADLAPEQKRALQYLLDHWPKHQDILNSNPIPQNGIPSGFFSSTYDVVGADELPKEDHWIWRQCNAKLSVVLDATTTVVMQKLNTRASITRSTDGLLSRPSYKMWNLRVIQTNSSFTFLYCEKGVDGKETNLESSPLQEESISSFGPDLDPSLGFESSDVPSSCHFGTNDWAW